MAVSRADREAAHVKFEEYARTRDRRLRDELIEDHLRLARYLASSFDNRGEPLDDLIQVASVGLLKAVERFEPGRGFEFTTFATPTILGELRRHFRDHGWAVRVPRRLQELQPRIATALAELTHELSRNPTVPEIAARLGLATDEVIEAMESSSAYRATSLDAPSAADDFDGPPTLGALLGGEDSSLTDAEERVTVRALLAELPERDRTIIYLRFFEDRTQSEIATRLNISQMHVSRLIAQSLARMRGTMQADETSAEVS